MGEEEEGHKTMTLRLTIFHSITIFVLAYVIYFHDALRLLIEYEHTRMSFVIFAVYVACSLYLAVKREAANFKAVNFQRSEMTALGLLGTVAGLSLLASSAGGDIEAFKVGVIAHLSSIFIPAGFGIGFSLLLGQQLSLCFGENE